MVSPILYYTDVLGVVKWKLGNWGMEDWGLDIGDWILGTGQGGGLEGIDRVWVWVYNGGATWGRGLTIWVSSRKIGCGSMLRSRRRKIAFSEQR
jgi:hypothetical protein